MASFLQSPRRIGLLLFWHMSENGGFGKVFIPSTRELFFIHRKFITAGQPIVGSTVSFIPAPPLEGKVYPQALACVIDNTKIIRGLSGLGTISRKVDAR
jgi:hypothetical protein